MHGSEELRGTETQPVTFSIVAIGSFVQNANKNKSFLSQTMRSVFRNAVRRLSRAQMYHYVYIVRICMLTSRSVVDLEPLNISIATCERDSGAGSPP